MARGRAPESTILGTRDNNKNHEFVHEGKHQKTRSRAQCFDKGKQCTKESTKKHDLQHGFWHEGERQKTRFLARGRAPKSTILCTRGNTKKYDLEHDFLHEGKHRKARYCARRKTLKTTFAQNIKEFLFLTVTAFRADSINKCIDKLIYIYIYLLCTRRELMELITKLGKLYGSYVEGFQTFKITSK